VNPPAPDFDATLDRLRDEGSEQWELRPPRRQRGEVVELVFRRADYRPAVIIDGDPDIAIPTRGRH
jgi:hypothetical protein